MWDPGSGDPGELRAAYSTGDLIAIPSLHEIFCNVMIESLLCGTPVLSSPHVGAPQLCESLGVVTVRTLDTQAWSAELARAMRPERRCRLWSVLRTTVAERFSRAAVGAAFESLYRRLASGAPPAAGAVHT